MSISLAPATGLNTLLSLEAVKPDAFLGSGPELGWERIYGGQVVAQALMAAGLTVRADHIPHSLHAYFVRAGDEKRPVLYEVERVRDGRSFTTRQVIAYQAGGAILNLIASFQVREEGDDVQGIAMPSFGKTPEEATSTGTDLYFEHRIAHFAKDPEPRVLVWMRTKEEIEEGALSRACALAYISDEHPLGVARLPHPLGMEWEKTMSASLDHAIWFHRPFNPHDWLLFDLEGYGVANSRGLAIARVFDVSGTHVATLAQEGLIRPRR